MNKLSTVLHTYYIDTSKENGAAEYAQLVGTIAEQTGGACKWEMERPEFYSEASRRQDDFMRDMHAADGQEIVFNTKHLFADQWNTSDTEGAETARNKRVWAWSECVYPNKRIKEGYWFAVTDDMRAVLRDTLRCGYCGYHGPASSGLKFCPACYGSEHLKPADLRLTRLLPVSAKQDRPELSDAERAELMPRYTNAQIYGETERQKARIAKAKERIEAEYVKTCAVALEKRDAARWIMAHVPGAYENWIFYSHTGRHCFGWRTPLDAGTASALLDAISEFPFLYELKCDDGRTLSN